jgi:hypothetical protein
MAAHSIPVKDATASFVAPYNFAKLGISRERRSSVRVENPKMIYTHSVIFASSRILLAAIYHAQIRLAPYTPTKIDTLIPIF